MLDRDCSHWFAAMKHWDGFFSLVCCTKKILAVWCKHLSRKLAMLAGVPLALARNMPGAGLANSLILSDLTLPPSPPPPPGGLYPPVVGSTPPPSIDSKTVVFTAFFALQGCETWVTCKFLSCSAAIPFGLPWSPSDTAWRKKNHRERVLHDGRVGFHLGGVLFSLRLSYLSMPCPC